MNNKTRIIIAGIGGVGGYFGGLLAKKYRESNEIEIIFIARGEHLQKIRSEGLKVIKGETEFIAFPSLATDDFAEAGLADYIILCTKSYDLEQTTTLLKPCLKDDTIIIPLLNGVNNAERIRRILPSQTVLDGCAYIVSHIKSPGVIENIGNTQKIFFGVDDTINKKFALLEKIMQDAGIDATLSQNISTIIWTKFIFISAIATATSYFDQPIGKVIENHENILVELIEEVTQIARAKKIHLDADIASKTLEKLKNVPYQNTTSMQRDFQNKKPHTELESLTKYVITAGQDLHIKTPTYQKLYESLEKKQ